MKEPTLKVKKKRWSSENDAGQLKASERKSDKSDWPERAAARTLVRERRLKVNPAARFSRSVGAVRQLLSRRKNRRGNLLFAGKDARHPHAFAGSIDAEHLVHEFGIALDDKLAALGQDIGSEEQYELVALLGDERLDGFANLGLAAKHGLKIDGFELADIDLVAIRKLEFLGIGVHDFIDGKFGRIGAALEDIHSVFHRIDANERGRLGDDVAVEAGRGGRLHDDGIGKHGAKQQRGDALRHLDALDGEFARNDGAGRAHGHGIVAKRLSRSKAAQAMMVDDFHDLGVGQTVGRLQSLVMVDENHLVTFAYALDQTRRLDAVFAQNPLGLGRQGAQAASLIRDVFAAFLGELVFQIGVADRRRDGIVVGVFVSKHQNRRHGVSSLYHFMQFTAQAVYHCRNAHRQAPRTPIELPAEGRFMRTLGIRDIIGPIMIGPSSSHTAGALRIASMCRRLLAGEPRQVSFRLYGSFAHTYHGHGTDKALVAGVLGMAADDERIRDSFKIAEQRGLSFAFEPRPNEPMPHPNTVCIEVTDSTGEHVSMRGESIGGGAAVITRINGIDVRLTGEFHSIVVKQRDVAGVLAHIATCLSVFDVNIATTKLFRERKGELAYTIMQTDDEIDERVAASIAKHPDIFDVRIVKSDRASEAVAPVKGGAAAGESDGFAADFTPQKAAAAFEELDFATGAELLAYCEREGVPISEAICRRERCMLASDGVAVNNTQRYLKRALAVMRESATAPLSAPAKSMGGLIGGEAAALSKLEGKGSPAKCCNLSGDSACSQASASEHAAGPASVADPLLARAATYAMAVLETNASMGRIVAAPTAGSSGVLPAMLLATQDLHGFSDEELVRALANAAAIGYLITRNATVAGAEGGCQAEVGAASAMAASAACELFGGSPRQCLAAASNALCGLMGLVCDPIAGLVEAPCQKRNATGVANAIVSAQIALAGVENLVGFDETVEAMRRVGIALPFELRESALGGLAATPSACAFCESCMK